MSKLSVYETECLGVVEQIILARRKFHDGVVRRCFQESKFPDGFNEMDLALRCDHSLDLIREIREENS